MEPGDVLDDPKFHGSDYVPFFDFDRLQRQQRRIYDLMSDHVWRTKAEVALATGYSEASVLAQFGNLRKLGIPVDKRVVGDRAHGLFEFKVGLAGTHVPKRSPLVERAERAEAEAMRLADALYELAPDHPVLLEYLYL